MRNKSYFLWMFKQTFCERAPAKLVAFPFIYGSVVAGLDD
jgi:hypothetical protein